MRIPRLRLASVPRLWPAIALVALLSGVALVVAAPWSGNSASEGPTETPAATGTPSATATARPTPSSTPTPEPTPSATARPENLLAIVYIAQTGGDGVSIRDACRDDARVPGAWAEGSAVRVIEPGTGACDGWTYVAGPGEGSWVWDGYLSETKPAVAPRPSGGGQPPVPGSPPPAGAPMFVFGTTTPGAFVLVFAGNQFCDSTIADGGIGAWGLEVGAGTECSPAPGALAVVLGQRPDHADHGPAQLPAGRERVGHPPHPLAVASQRASIERPAAPCHHPPHERPRALPRQQ